MYMKLASVYIPVSTCRHTHINADECRYLGESVIPTALVGGVARRTAAQDTPRTSLGRAWARKGYSKGAEWLLTIK